ncbi:type V CRISPR-associated protein Cas12b [Thermodesulfobacteriota bacterium]
MPTRTINLKMVLGKKAETAKLRQALWTTHLLVNKAVAEIEKTLLLCRGCSYWTLNENDEEISIPESQVAENALKIAREAQRRNGKEGTGSDEEILYALRQLYEQIVPSCKLDDNDNPLKGDAQSIGNSYAGPLFDSETCEIKNGKNKDTCGPFAETASKKIAVLPHWIKKIDKSCFDNKNSEHFKYKNDEGVECYYSINLKKANSWYKSKAVQEMLSSNKAFNKDGWKKEKEKGSDSWAVNFARKQINLSEDPRMIVRQKLWKELGLLPIGNLFFDKKTVGNLWNRLAMRLAVAHLLSWESWNHSTKKAHVKAREVRDSLLEDHNGLTEKFNLFREYERARHLELKRVAFADDDRPFRIGSRSIRAWNQVREAWLANGKSEKVREKIIKDLQTKLRGKFGDPDLFLWLLKDGREHLWKDVDSLTPLVKLNVSERLLEKRKEYSLMTFADARKHPRWAMFEAPGGSNLRNYTIKRTENGVGVVIPLLFLEEGIGLKEIEFTAALAPSGQLSALSIESEEKGKNRFKYRSAHQDFEGVPGGAELLFDRPYLEHSKRTEAILAQKPGPVWFKLTIDVENQAPKDWLSGTGRVATPPEVHHFKTALSNKSKHTEKLQPGLHVLSVDLGMRTFASCSVFELVKGKPEKGLYFPASDGRNDDNPEKLWARHKRSFKITLPGEKPSRNELSARKAAMDEVRSIRRDIGCLKNILRLSILEDDSKRDEQVKSIIESFDDVAMDSALTREMLEGLGDQKFKSTPELWEKHCQGYYDKADSCVSERFSNWRKRTRPKSSSWQDWHERRSYHGGKSIWMLDYLDAVRRLILSWNLRGRTYGAVNRQDKKLFGTIASGLLHHINQLKADRVKSGADLIVQAARGYIPRENGSGWQKKFEPCRVILFEDLARYRFRVDRPRRENSQLMKWNHREILTEATMQAELYGMVVETTAAGFSSRYLASSGAPGVRCRYLKDDDFENGFPKNYVVFELQWMLGNCKDKNSDEKQKALKNKLKPGMCIPWSGGELFATIKDGTDAIHFIHADINAAQNLQRRFWNRCGEAYRITCNKVSKDGVDAYELAQTPGARLLGALQQLKNGSSPFYLELDPTAQSNREQYVMELSGDKRSKIKAENDDTSMEDTELEDALAEISEDSVSRGETFFRDPSGILADSKHWIPSKQYWSMVKKKIWKGMLKNNYGDKHEAVYDDIPY